MNTNGLMMPFTKYAQCILRVLVHDEKKFIKGVFRNKNTGNIIHGDNFLAVLVGKGSAEETYKAYLSWYNHTREDKEKEAEREYVSAEFGEEK